MSVLVVLGLGLLGGVGATGRFLLDGAVGRRVGRAFPFGTLAVNLSGAVVLGALAGATITADAYRLWGIGLVGAYTTFSTWTLESHRLAEERQGHLAAVDFAVSLALGILVVFAGRKIGAAL